MTRGEVHKKINGAGGWYGADERCRAAFANAMQSRDFGEDALIDAWLWFHFGWTAAQIAVRTESTEARALL